MNEIKKKNYSIKQANTKNKPKHSNKMTLKNLNKP